MISRTALLLTPEAPSATGSGLQQRAFAWVNRLATEHAVTVLVWNPPLDDNQPCSLPGPLRRSILLSGLDLSCCRDGFDVCLVFRLRMHKVAQALRDYCEIDEAWLDLDDIESAAFVTIAWRATRRGRLRLVLRSLRRAACYFIQERTIPRIYSKVFVAAPEDRTRLAPGVEVFCMPNRIALPAAAIPTASNARIATLLFVGTLSYFPNEDAALFLATTLAPRLRRSYGAAFRIVIAGRGTSERLRKELMRVPEIDFRGEVEFLGPLYQEAHIAMVPIRCGGGTKLKALEAIAYRRAIVAFPQGMRGLGLRAGVDYLGADDAADFAAACLELLRSPLRAFALADSAAHHLVNVHARRRY